MLFLGCHNVVDMLFKNSAKMKINVNKKDSEGMTGLMHACKERHELVVQTFIRQARFHKIAFNSKDNSGRTAFIWACKPSREKKIKAAVIEAFCENFKRLSIDLWIEDENGKCGRDYADIYGSDYNSDSDGY